MAISTQISTQQITYEKSFETREPEKITNSHSECSIHAIVFPTLNFPYGCRKFIIIRLVFKPFGVGNDEVSSPAAA